MRKSLLFLLVFSLFVSKGASAAEVDTTTEPSLKELQNQQAESLRILRDQRQETYDLMQRIDALEKKSSLILQQLKDKPAESVVKKPEAQAVVAPMTAPVVSPIPTPVPVVAPPEPTVAPPPPPPPTPTVQAPLPATPDSVVPQKPAELPVVKIAEVSPSPAPKSNPAIVIFIFSVIAMLVCVQWLKRLLEKTPTEPQKRESIEVLHDKDEGRPHLRIQTHEDRISVVNAGEVTADQIKIFVGSAPTTMQHKLKLVSTLDIGEHTDVELPLPLSEEALYANVEYMNPKSGRIYKDQCILRLEVTPPSIPAQTHNHLRIKRG